jgi:plasmid stabilization system protein ParE
MSEPTDAATQLVPADAARHDQDKKARKAQKKAKKAARELETPRDPGRLGKSKGGALPEDRPSLLKLHRKLRHRRDALPLLSEERAKTVIDIARVEVQVARIERAMDPPLG